MTISYDRNWPTEGPSRTTGLTFSGAGTFASVTVDGTIARPPAISNANGFVACFAGPPRAILISVLGTIVDETDPVTAELSLVDPTGAPYGPVATAVKGTEHSAAIDIDADRDGVVEAGNWSWTLTAFDGFGNIGTSGGTTVVSPQPCP